MSKRCQLALAVAPATLIGACAGIAVLWLAVRGKDRPMQPVLDAIAQVFSYPGPDGNRPQALDTHWGYTGPYRRGYRTAYDLSARTDLVIDISSVKSEAEVYRSMTGYVERLCSVFPGGAGSKVGRGGGGLGLTPDDGRFYVGSNETWEAAHWASGRGFHVGAHGRVYDFVGSAKHPVPVIASEVKGRRVLWLSLTVTAWGFTDMAARLPALGTSGSPPQTRP